MAIRLDRLVVRGEIDNRLEGHVMGRVWLLGRQEPVCLNLAGNCLRDIAGHRIAFTNRCMRPNSVDTATLTALQEGIVGDMTASRKVQIPEVSVEKLHGSNCSGKDSTYKTANSLYLEWFSTENGRVVIELLEFEIDELSEAEWRMTQGQEESQRRANEAAMRSYIESGDWTLDKGWIPDVDKPMDEFEWEKALRESDELTDKFSDAFEKYINHPDAEKLLAREMGWDWLDDALDADDRGMFADARYEIEDLPPLEPDPATEGTDWVRTEDGDIKHPLSQWSATVTMNMWHGCKTRGLLTDDGDDDLHEMLFQSEILSAKLAGALDSLGYDNEPDAGFVVACLKRSLLYFDKSIEATEKVSRKQILDDDEIEVFRTELFGIREAILHLMKKYRTLL